MPRGRNLPTLGLKTILFAVFLAAAVGAIGFRTVHASPPQGAHVLPASATIGNPTAPKIPAPGTALYDAKRGDAVISVARHYLPQTSYLTSTEDFEVRAIYLTGLMAASDHGIKIVKHWRETGGNAVVFDIKDSDGTVNIPFEHPLIGAHKAYIRDLPKYTRFLHSQGMHAIARIAMFRDERLVVSHPELAVKSKKTGQPWRENGKLVWTDPSRIDVQEYDIALALTAVAGGADEIQFDYVRFPAEGDQNDAGFSFQKSHPEWQRSDVIVDFLQRAYTSLHPKGVLLSLDVFGVMAWQRSVDLAHTGQDIVRMARYCDVLSPMIYPSHFFGMDGIDKPGDAPEHFIGESMDRFALITKGSGAVIRPWLQAFAWRTKTYSPKYIEVQVLTSRNKGGIGFLFWNANNDYSKPYAAMPEMKAAKGQYFRGDEVPGVLKARMEVAAGNAR